VVLAWFTADRVARPGWGRALLGVYATALAVVYVFCAVRIHHTGGGRDHYGPTLANQLQVARTLNRYVVDRHLEIEPYYPGLYPNDLPTLRRIVPLRVGRWTKPIKFRIVYASDDPADGRIAAVRVPVDPEAPPTVPPP
jgi:hypothetical protein